MNLPEKFVCNQDNTTKEMCENLISQMRKKLYEQNTKTVKKLEEVDKVADKRLQEGKIQDFVTVWEKNKNNQQENESKSVFDEIINKLKKWRI